MILRDFFCISIYYVSALSLHIESTDSMIYIYIYVTAQLLTVDPSVNLSTGL